MSDWDVEDDGDWDEPDPDADPDVGFTWPDGTDDEDRLDMEAWLKGDV